MQIILKTFVGPLCLEEHTLGTTVIEVFPLYLI